MYQVIFRLPSLSESEKAFDGVRKELEFFSPWQRYLFANYSNTSRHGFADFYKFILDTRRRERSSIEIYKFSVKSKLHIVMQSW